MSRFHLTVVLLGSALTFFSCGSGGTGGGAGGGSTGGSGGSGGGTAGGSGGGGGGGGNAGGVGGGTAADAGSAIGACTDLTADIPDAGQAFVPIMKRTDVTRPSPMGGTLLDGVYRLTKVEQWFTGAGTPNNSGKQTLEISNGRFKFIALDATNTKQYSGGSYWIDPNLKTIVFTKKCGLIGIGEFEKTGPDGGTYGTGYTATATGLTTFGGEVSTTNSIGVLYLTEFGKQ